MRKAKAAIIGINDYPGNSLTSCINDAETVSTLLKSNEDGSPNFDVKTYKNITSKNKLTEIVYDLFKGENEIALLYFAGHGRRNELDTFLVTPDAEKYDLGLSVTNLLKIANESKSNNRVIVLDCCHSGAAGTANFLNDAVSLIHKGVTILTASKSDEEAKEIVNGHGVFTNLLIQALNGGAADISGCVTPGSIYAYVDQALGPYDQRPIFKTNITEFASLRKVKPLVPVEILRKISEYFPRPDYFYPLDPSHEETNSDQVIHKVISPQANTKNVAIFKDLQKYQSAGLVSPVDATYMYFAAMNFKSCKLTPYGKHYWRLAKRGRI